jgi:hypothetical protein
MCLRFAIVKAFYDCLKVFSCSRHPFYVFFINLEKKSGLAGCVTCLEVHYTLLSLFRESNLF